MAYPIRESDAHSIASRTSCLTNVVESLFGHAAAKGIASDVDLTNDTLRHGCQMLTHASTGLESSDKPYRWMSLRYVTFKEVSSLKTFHEASTALEPQMLKELQEATGLWHFVIRELRQKEESDPPIVTTYFGSRLEIVSCTVQEKFDLLDDDDDPRIIEAALHDEDFSRLLEDYFMTGDTHNQKWFKTLATFSVFDGKPLLHFCCERGLSNCVEYLLKYHSIRTAKSPWLQLADPFWQDRKWGNSAFSIAAYLGDVETLEVLVSWAQEHNQLWRALQLKDKKKEDLFQLLQARIEKGQGTKGNPKKAYNLLAAAAGRPPLSGYDVDSVSEASNGGNGRAIVLVDPSQKKGRDAVDRLEERGIYSLDETMTLASLSDVFKEMQKDTDILQGKSVLIINLKLIPAADGKDDEAALNLLLSLQTCCRSA